MSRLQPLQRQLRAMSDATTAAVLARFFKTAPGDYGAGDRFLGVKVPRIRRLLPAGRDLSLAQIGAILRSPYHEERMLALLLLVQAYEHGDATAQGEIYRWYLVHAPAINNWDLVDCSAPKIVGHYLLRRRRSPLFVLARSDNLWERRIAVVATLTLIRAGDFAATLRLGRQLLDDEHDLIHKAVGWMLREVGKRDRCRLETFLALYAHRMPRIMLRYALEKLPASRRAVYLRADRQA